MLSRRGLLFGAAAVAAPAIIRTGILMPIKRILMPEDGIGLYAMPHPFERGVAIGRRGLTEEALLSMMTEMYSRGNGLKLRPTHLVRL